jgi:hypothetical protein
VLVIVTGIMLLLMRATLRWVAQSASRRAGAQFQAVEQIVNEGRPPESWLQPYRQKIERLHQRGASAVDIEREGREAQRHCLQRLDQLIRFLKDGSFYDSPESKVTVLETMEERRAEWAAQGWQALMQWNG